MPCTVGGNWGDAICPDALIAAGMSAFTVAGMEHNEAGSTPAPIYVSRGGKLGHSAIEAVKAAETLGDWLEQNPDRSLWSFRIPMGNAHKLIVYETGGELVFCTEASPADCETIMDLLGIRKSLDETISVLTRDGMNLLEAGEVAALLL